MSDDEPAKASVPVLRVLEGDPSAEELAALIVVLAARAGGADAAPPPAAGTSSPWACYWRSAREPLRHGAGAWRSSALPR